MILVGGLDVAELAFYLFFMFFIVLVIYLNREGRREGYPLRDEISNQIVVSGGWWADPGKKVYRLPFGKGEAYTPTGFADPVKLKGRQSARFHGAPLEPIGDPLTSGLGPAAVTKRADYPDLTAEGHDRIVPLRASAEFFILERDPDPRGWTVLGSDGEVAGTVSEVWIDKSDRLIRYLEVATVAGPHALAPMTMLSVDRRKRAISIDSLSAAQFAGAPQLAESDRITRNEEELIVGYFGGGYLYSRPTRVEPIL